MNAIREHCKPDIRESLEWAALDFIAAWTNELDALSERGDCEIAARYTWHGRPVIVTVG